MKFLIIFIMAICCCSCNSNTVHRDMAAESPYGVWSTGRGFTVLIFPGNRYQFCSSLGCESGIVDRPGKYTWLLGAAVGSVGKDFAKKSGYNPSLLKPVGHEQDLDFGVNITQEQANSGVCDGHACVLFGTDEDQFYFKKVDDF